MLGLTLMHNCSRYSGEDLQTMYLYSLGSFLFIFIPFIIVECLPDAVMIINRADI